MKIFKGCLIFLVLIAALLGILYLSGLQTEYYFVEAKNGEEYIELVKDDNFRLILSVSSDKKSKEEKIKELFVGLTFTDVNQDVNIKNVEIEIFDSSNTAMALDSVYAIDGFYSWKEERNSRAKTFELLPKPFQTISKSIEAYFVYSWYFKANNQTVDKNAISVSIQLESNKKVYRVDRDFLFELESKKIFRSPIRVH